MDLKHFLGDFGADFIRGYHSQNRGVCLWCDQILWRFFCLVGAAQNFVDHPVGGFFTVTFAYRGFKVVGQIHLCGQHGGVIFCHAVVLDKAGFFFIRQFRQTLGDIVYPALFDLQREQVGTGKVAVIMGFFFGAHGTCFILVRIVQTSLLIDFSTGFNNRNLTAGFIFDRRLNEAHGVHVLYLTTRAEVREVLCFHILLILSRTANRHVNVSP
mmetsp:Transcript_499/g.1393  ORF Transcript_499/g.1393 Transcript_499/m.1393 type:complete len:213 (+) Transcript_499:333-971(+)